LTVTLILLNRTQYNGIIPNTRTFWMPLRQNPSNTTALLLIAPFFLWGTAMVAMKGTVPHTTPFFLAGFRLLPAGILVLLWALGRGRSQPKTWTAWAWILVFGCVDGTLFQGFLAQGLQRTGAGLGSVMIDSQPLAVALLAAWLFGERIGVIGAIGLLIGVLGISLLGLPETFWAEAFAGSWAIGQWDLVEAVQGLFENGQWLMLLAALSMAVGTVLSRYVSRHVDPVVATGWHMIVGGLPLFGLSAWGETQQWQQMTVTDWGALGYATVLGSAIAYGLFFYFAASGSLTSLSALTFLTPVFALFFGNLFLGETLSELQWFGVGLTLVSIYGINQRDAIAQWLGLTVRVGHSEKIFDSPDVAAELEKIDLLDDSPRPMALMTDKRLITDTKVSTAVAERTD
jgi:drug/metabolite transporter (DMT)-like permease